jgi:hypothetical protein
VTSTLHALLGPAKDTTLAGAARSGKRHVRICCPAAALGHHHGAELPAQVSIPDVALVSSIVVLAYHRATDSSLRWPVMTNDDQ